MSPSVSSCGVSGSVITGSSSVPPVCSPPSGSCCSPPVVFPSSLGTGGITLITSLTAASATSFVTSSTL